MSPNVRLQAALADRYTVLEEIGHGGMATVYLARDVRHARDVAIKVLNSELAASIGAERFSREIRIAATLQHPNILPLYDSGSDGELLYYVMPFVTGASLRARLQHEKQLSVPEAIRITRQIAEGLEYAHSRGVIHRDIKPENILLSGEQVFVADFGVARARSSGADGAPITSTGVTVGTPQYMSPEQATAETHLDARSDVYALGCVFYEMLAGEPPFTGPSMAAIVARHLQAPIPDVSILRPAIAPELVDALSSALAKSPADRFPSVAAFAAAISGDMTTPGRTRATRLAAQRFRSARRLGIAAAAVAVVAAGAWFGRGLLGARGEGDPNLLLIAPFNVIDRNGDLEIWREGVLDIVSRNLHGAGALRTVSPTLVVNRIRGTADQASVESAARALRAGLGVYGTLTRHGADSLRLHATTVRIGDPEPSFSIDITGPVDRMDQLCDSLSIKLLESLQARGHEAVGRASSVRTTSITALKDFLRGEQLVRAALYDSAEYYFQRASELDTAFTLAHQRRYFVRLHQGDGGESTSDYALALRAGQLNRSLAPRDSMLVAIDSIQAAIALRDYSSDSLGLVLRQRLFRAVDSAAVRFPGDAEVWFRVGTARLRFQEGEFFTADAILEPFDRSIEVDSSFLPPYRYAIEHSMVTSGHVEGRRHIEAYLRRNPPGVNGDGMRLALRLMNSEGRAARETDRWIAEASAAVAYAALQALFWWPDSAETSIRVARRIASDPVGRAELAPSNEAWGRIVQSVTQSWRGRLADAVGTWGSAEALFGRFTPLAAQIAALGGIPPAEVDRLLSRSLSSPRGISAMGPQYLAYWGARGDTAMLRRVQREALAALSTPNAASADRLRYLADGAGAYLTLLSGDSATAMARFSALPKTACPSCDLDRLTLARLHARHGRAAVTDSILRHDANRYTEPAGVLWRLERAHAAERRGDRETAIRAYRFVADVWRHADPALQRLVQEAREALRRLGA